MKFYGNFWTPVAENHLHLFEICKTHITRKVYTFP